MKGTTLRVLVICVFGLTCLNADQQTSCAGPLEIATYRTPVDLAVVPGGEWLATANLSSNTVSLVNLGDKSVSAEIEVGSRPASIAARDEDSILVTTSESAELVALDIVDGELTETGRVRLGFEPRGLAVSPDGGTAFVALSMASQLATVNLAGMSVVDRIEVGSLPRFVAIAPDGASVAVTCSGTSEVVLIDTASRTIQARFPFRGINLGEPAFAPSGREIFFPWTYDGGGHPSPGNIRRGWVTGSRLGRIRLDEDETLLQGMTLDVQGKAVGDVLGIAVADEGRSLLVAAGGTHELLWFRAHELPFTQISGSEVMEPSLVVDSNRFRRVPVGGRPLAIRVSHDGGHAYVANALADSVQVINLVSLDVIDSIPLGDTSGLPAETVLARKGEAIFHDATRSLDQWYSCQTCHYEGGGNTVTMDTLNDGSSGSYKTVLPLYHVAETGPWTWHGWQTDLHAAVRKSMIDSMQGPHPSDEDVEAVVAYLRTLKPLESPFREADGGLSEAAQRGRELFSSDRAGCVQCHAGELLTSSETYDVGLIRSEDKYPGYSPPSLIGVYRKTKLLHHGRAKSVREVLAGQHSPERVSGAKPFTDRELDDLVAYLLSL